ncbi:VOC family protein [bacterium]|nr:MAG: VOC family protein [bacterium]
MAIVNVLAVVPVAEFEIAKAWYGRLFEREADYAPMEGLAEWHFTETSGVQIVKDPVRAGRSMLTVVVDDLDAQVAKLREIGLDPRGLDTDPIMARIAMVDDPEGNQITFAQPLGEN